MIVLDKTTSIFNWKLINKDIFPEEYNNAEAKEDFELLFMVNIDHVKLKLTLRNSTRDPNLAVRKFLWKRILLNESTTATTIEKYNEKKSILFGKDLNMEAELPDFVDTDHLVYYYLNDEGQAAVSRVLNVLASAHPDITFAPLLLPLASLFLHYMEDAECYACILSVVESNNKITQTDIHWATTNHVFRRFSQKYAHTAYEYVLEALFKQSQDPSICLEAIDNWMWWIFKYLPFNYVLNIVDSFLLEGQKVIYRYGIAILDSYYKSLNTQRPLSLKPNFMNEYCAKIDMPFERIIKLAFGFRNMSRKNIEHVFNAEEKAIKKLKAKNSQNSLNQNDNNIDSKNPLRKLEKSSLTSSLAKNRLIEQCEAENEQMFYLSDSEMKENIDAQTMLCKRTNWTLTDAFKNIGLQKKSKKWHDQPGLIHNHSFYHYHHPQSNLNLPSFSVEKTGSTILSPKQITQIWKWLPTRYQILELQVIYSSNIHGSRLMTLFDKIEFYQTTIIVIQTMSNSIFGAFCSQPWSDRIKPGDKKPKFFGNGETFLFEISPNMKKYEWIGKATHGDTQANQELFLYANNDHIVIGGSTVENNGPGLLINSNLVNGCTAVSDTFENGLLGSESDFEIATLEVISFNNIF